ncbi:TPA: hypothetical protein ACYU3I_001831 [Neisseria gonorrhoeae]
MWSDVKCRLKPEDVSVFRRHFADIAKYRAEQQKLCDNALFPFQE